MDNIRNVEGHIVNTQIFSEEAQHFKKYGYYCADAELTPSWFEYWGEQRRRCLNGYESGGLKIPGDMYHYLNFSPIQRVLEDSKRGKRAKKGTDFPDFWDGDYNYFWIREIARNGILSCMGYSGEKEEEIYSLENQLEVDKLLLEEYNKLHLYFSPVAEDLRGGKDLIIGKARRKGYQQPNSEIVMTPNGKKTMGELIIGEEVLTPSGKSKILDIYPQGLDDVYELTLYDGRKVRCGIDHLWKTNYNIINTKTIIKLLKLNKLIYIPSYKDKTNRIFDRIINVEKLDYQENSSCILIDSEDHLYLTKDYIVTHNSFKNASIFTKNFFHIPNSYTMFIAYEKKYLFPGSKTVFGKALSIINFINSHTAFSQPSDEIAKQNHIRASYIEYDGSGKKMSKGFMSEGEAISFKDNPDSGRGADAYDIFGEEVGAWGTPGGLKETLQSMRSSSEAGIYKTGLITFYGTSGDVLGSTADFNDLFNRPQASNFMAFYDIWGDIKEKTEGLFMPKQLNLEGFQNTNGVSDIIGARKAEVEIREELIRKGATSAEIRRRMLEEPLNSGEAFSIISFNNFPIVELENRRKLITVNNQYRTKAIPVEMFYDSGELKVEPILKFKHDPIWSFKDKTFDTEGCILIYHQPNPNYLKNSYSIGYDPYRQDKGDSNGSIVVIDKLTRRLAAKYIGRREDPEAVDKIAEMLCDYYNSRLMFENEVTSVKNYFKKVRRLHLLAFQPDYVITKEIKKSKVKRVFGCHMTESLKDAGERYTKEWFLDVIDFDEDSKPITVIDTLWDLELIEEAIAYYRKGNFDTISALFMALFDMQETLLSKRKDDEDEESNAAQLMKQYHAMIKN